MKKLISPFLLAAVLLVSACNKEKDGLAIPASYDGSNFTINAAEELAFRAQLVALTNLMKTGRTTGTSVSESSLNTAFNAGSPSLSSVSTSFFQTQVPLYFTELAAASGGTYNPMLQVAGQGGTFGGSSKYLFTEQGTEMEQLVEKGLFGAAQFNRAKSILMSSSVSLADIDKAVALFGAHPDFPNSNDATKHTNPDVHTASYAARRDDNSGTGVYLCMKKNFIKAQAAIKAGSDYNKERDQAIAALLSDWEKALAATVVNYSFDAISKLSATNPDDASRASALHGLSESSAFLIGFRTQAGRISTDGQLDAILAVLRNPAFGNGSQHEFVKFPVAAVEDIQSLINQVKAVYGFTDAEIESFRKNWVAEQGR